MTLNVAYGHLARFLTNVEFQRTQTEYDESLALKIYLFQFVNYYSSLFYIAFLKGKFISYPGNYYRIGKYRQEECPYGGCFFDLTTQLVIIMIGKQFLNAMQEMMPFVWKSMCGSRSVKKIEDIEEIPPKQWVNDYRLTPIPPTGLFYEYLEMGESKTNELKSI
jgi:anoctamin-1